MPAAGFYAIHNSEIRFGSDGLWYADGDPILNTRIADLFSRSVEPTEAGGYRLRVGDETADIVVEDTPYVVIDVAVENTSTASQTVEKALTATLNDGSREDLTGAALEQTPDNVLYASVKEGTERARILRHVFHRLAPFFEEVESGGFQLRVENCVIPIRNV